MGFVAPEPVPAAPPSLDEHVTVKKSALGTPAGTTHAPTAPSSCWTSTRRAGGGVPATNASVGGEYGPVPLRLSPRTVHVYVLPFVSPSISIGDTSANVAVTSAPPSDD